MRSPAEPVALEDLRGGELKTLIADLAETLLAVGGSGLAAPQLAIGRQVLVYRPLAVPGSQEEEPPRLIINPMLEPEHGDLVYDWEDCLSVPALKGLVPRYPKVRVRGVNQQGEPLDLSVEGIDARVLQHAYDHLNGVVFLDRMRDLRSLAFAEEWSRYLADSDST